MADADCFIYVANATRSLAEDELELIRFLYDHYTNSGGRKRVIWVVTAIDRTMELGIDDQPAWKATVARNNAYLKENFVLPDGRPDSGFIGPGFLAVSPALEARGGLLLSQGKDPEGRQLVAESRMGELRRVLDNLIRTDTGKRHITAVATEVGAIVAPRYQTLADRLHDERLPIDQLTAQRTELGKRLHDLKAATDTTGSELEGMLQQRLRIVERPFEQLAAHLHAALDEQIRSADLRRRKEENYIQVLKTQIIREWITAPDGSAAVWEREFESFTTDVLGVVRPALRASDHPVGEFGVGVTIDIEQLTVPRSERPQADTQNILQRASAVVGLLSTATTAVIGELGLASGATLLVPGGMAATALAYAAFKFRNSNTTSLDVLRDEWIEDLNRAADEARRWFISTAGIAGSNVISRAVKILAERRNQLARRIIDIDDRMAQAENVDRQELIAHIEPLCARGDKLVSSVAQLIRA